MTPIAPPLSTRSAYAAQLDRGFRWLCFDRTLERRFRDAWTADFLPRLRIHIILGILIYAGFGIIDLIWLSTPAAQWSLLIRWAGVTPPALAVLAMTYTNLKRRALVAAVMGCMVGAGWGLVAIAAIAASTGVPLYFASLSLVAVCTYFLAGLLLYEAIACGVAVMLATIVAALAIDLPPQLFVYHLSFLIAANIFGIAGCYALETAHRGEFLRTRLLREITERDRLTGVHNRSFFEETGIRTLTQATRQHTSIAVVMADVDGFKAYNDRFGHPAGDHCLTQVAAVLASYTQRPLDIVARYGGEEFAILWFDITEEDARALCERVRAAVASINLAPDDSATRGAITISIGAAVVTPSSESNLHRLVTRADQALYQAKRQGRDRCVVEALR